MSQAEAIRTFGVSRTALYLWLQKAKAKGTASLASQERGRPPSPTLRGHQAATIVRMITDRCPEQLKLPFVLWTREADGELIRQRTGLRLSVWTVGRLLKRWGFTPQKPLRRAYERDPEAVRRWLKETYPAIRDEAKRENAEIQ